MFPTDIIIDWGSVMKAAKKYSFNSSPVKITYGRKNRYNRSRDRSRDISINQQEKIVTVPTGYERNWNQDYPNNLYNHDQIYYPNDHDRSGLPNVLKNTDNNGKKDTDKIRNTSSRKSKKYTKNNSDMNTNQYLSVDIPSEIIYTPFDAVRNCKSAGIIPYSYDNGVLYFLLQRMLNPQRKKDVGWNDFGGKQQNSSETTAIIAAREFSEETSCLFYLKDKIDDQSNNNNNNSKSIQLYDLLKNNDNLNYSKETITILKKLIEESQKYYSDKITEFVSPIFLSSKETYISYFVKVKYIPESDLPKAEDFHIPYEDTYLRECRWFSADDIMTMDEKNFHKRLQITRIQQRIFKYLEKNLFS